MAKARSGPLRLMAAADFQVVGGLSIISLDLIGFRIEVPWGLMGPPDDGGRLYLALDGARMVPFRATEIEMTDTGWAALLHPTDPPNGS